MIALMMLLAGMTMADDEKKPTLVYSQSTGELKLDGKVIGKGYAGSPEGKNDPDKEAIRNVGPIPRGKWAISKPRTYKKMANCFDLTPIDHKAHGRSEFLIHGDSKDKPGTASRGCIILGPEVREAILKSGATVLEVVR